MRAFRLPVASKTATRLEFTDDTFDGKTTPFTIEGRSVTLKVTEKPVIVLIP